MIGCIIQARMGSSRLPGKVLKSVINNISVLEFQLQQLSYSNLIEKIVVATTTLEEDMPIVDLCRENNIEYFRGESKNVLDRYYQCAKKYNFSTIVRIPSDKPLIDPEIVDEIVKYYPKHDYITTFLTPSYPSGTEVELLSFDTLKSVWEKAKLPSELEHVTRYIHTHQNEFDLLNIESNRFDFQLISIVKICDPININYSFIPIKTIYLKNNYDSRFKPVLDSLNIIFSLLKFYFKRFLFS